MTIDPDNDANPEAPRAGGAGSEHGWALARRLQAVPRIVLGQWPTPLQQVVATGSGIQGAGTGAGTGGAAGGLWVKRDDLSGFGRGGAKVRKIEGVLGAMRAQGCDGLAAVVGNITNLGFDLVPALARLDAGLALVIADDPPLPMARRQALFAGLGVEPVWAGRWRVEVAWRWWWAGRALRAQGHRVFMLPPGAAHPAAVIGSALAMLELAEQLRAVTAPEPWHVWVSAATGTTLAGFQLGACVARAAGLGALKLTGVQVYPGRCSARMRCMLAWTRRWLRLEPAHAALLRAMQAPRMLADPCPAGARRFGAFEADLAGLCADVGRRHGLDIDPVFGGKCWLLMERERSKAAAAGAPGSTIYWHCGHTPEWREFGEPVRSVARRGP